MVQSGEKEVQGFIYLFIFFIALYRYLKGGGSKGSEGHSLR